MARVTISDVARQAHVSMGTVSNMLNHPERVRPETRKRIQTAIDRLGFVPNRSARALAGGTNQAFGLLLTGLDHAFSLQLAQGAHDTARAAGYDLLITSTDNDQLLANHYVDFFRGAHMAGIVMEPRPSAAWIPQWPDDLPMVLVDYHDDRREFGQVYADNVQAGREAARHALKLGRRRVAVLTADDDIQSLTDRIDGVRSVLDDGVEIVYADDWRGPRAGLDAGMRLARRPAEERPDFVIALTDVLAAGCIDGIRRCGLDVPDDIAVMGCDGNPLAWGGSVPLTTIEPHGYEMGAAAIRILLDEIRQDADGQDRATHAQVAIPSRLLIRESTAGRKH